uniref:Uncharacterized protein n=1 Tax=Noccaea caerulescens TaxID=107243 RepID=A0A1J3F237_NOCCA
MDKASQACFRVKAAYPSNSPSVKTYGSTSTTTTVMDDQTEPQTIATTPSSNALIIFSFGHLSDQDSFPLEPFQDVDQVTTSLQRTLRERPVKQTQKVQDMLEWSIAKGRVKRGKRGRG